METYGLRTSQEVIKPLTLQHITKSIQAGTLNMIPKLARKFAPRGPNLRVLSSGNWGTEDITLPGGLVAKDVLFGDATSPGAGSGFMGIRYNS